jgi:hypothetical protein
VASEGLNSVVDYPTRRRNGTWRLSTGIPDPSSVLGGVGMTGSGGRVTGASRSPTISFRFATIRHENVPLPSSFFA